MMRRLFGNSLGEAFTRAGHRNGGGKVDFESERVHDALAAMLC